MTPWHGADDAVIDAGGLPAQVLAYAVSRDGIIPALWRETGLDGPDVPPGCKITPRQYLRLLDNTARVLDSPDTSFMVGQQFQPRPPAPCGTA